MPPDAITKIKVISDLTLQKKEGANWPWLQKQHGFVTKCPLIHG